MLCWHKLSRLISPFSLWVCTGLSRSLGASCSLGGRCRSFWGPVTWRSLSFPAWMMPGSLLLLQDPGLSTSTQSSADGQTLREIRDLQGSCKSARGDPRLPQHMTLCYALMIWVPLLCEGESLGVEHWLQKIFLRNSLQFYLSKAEKRNLEQTWWR